MTWRRRRQCGLVRVSGIEEQVNRFERRFALHHNPDRLQERILRSLVKGQRQNVIQEWTKPSAQLRRTWGQRLNMSHWCIPGSHKDQQHIKLRQQNHCQEVKGRDCSLLLITQWTAPGVLLKAEADRADRVSTGPPGQPGPALWNESGGTGLPLPREGTALGEHNSCQSESERCLSKRQSTVLYRVHRGSTRGKNLEMMKVSMRNREEKLIMRVLKEVSQRGCETCILGGLQDPAG